MQSSFFKGSMELRLTKGIIIAIQNEPCPLEETYLSMQWVPYGDGVYLKSSLIKNFIGICHAP